MADGDIKVVFYGYNDFKKLLKEFDPELRKAMDKEIRDSLKPLASKARGLVPIAPLSNWTRPPEHVSDDSWKGYRVWDPENVRKGIVIRQGGKRFRGRATISMWRFANRNAAGSIYELAGRRGGKTPQGRAFIRNLNNAGGKASRLIWHVWDQENAEGKIEKNVFKTVNEYERKLQEGLDMAGNGEH
jgi:hypothetical protein